jgi:ribosomal protein S18 acetylase RimI-like enzyme
MTVDYRDATIEDVTAIRELARECWEHDYPDIVSRESIRDGIDEWYDEAHLRIEVSRGDTLLQVADEDGAVVGFAHAIWNEGVGELLRVYVAPSHRNRGIGNALLDHTIDALERRGADRLRAMVLADNDLGNQFYRDAGFEKFDDDETVIGGQTYRETVYERQ